MEPLASKAKSLSILIGALALVAVITILPPAFAITFTDANNPHGPMAPVGWAVGMGAAGVMSGIGVWIAVRRGKVH